MLPPHYPCTAKVDDVELYSSQCTVYFFLQCIYSRTHSCTVQCTAILHTKWPSHLVKCTPRTACTGSTLCTVYKMWRSLSVQALKYCRVQTNATNGTRVQTNATADGVQTNATNGVRVQTNATAKRGANKRDTLYNYRFKIPFWHLVN